MRWLVGLLLISAAVLKAVQLISEPATAHLSALGPYFPPIQIGAELAIGLLVMTGAYWRAVRWLVLGLFLIFAGYSASLALQGAISCGCFGQMRVHPWWTFGLDLFVTLGIVCSILFERRTIKNDSETADRSISKPVVAAPWVVWLVVGVGLASAALLLRHVNQGVAGATDSNASAGLIVLDPEKWVGRKLPIADAIDVDLLRGEWTVLLHRHDCPVCREEIPRFVERAAAGERVALVEVPPYGSVEPGSDKCVRARLSDAHEWFVHTPVEIHLRDGEVTAAKMIGD
ncbi:MAG TPA: MauE/DoxX family redox-associated membrane protein [Lacipirellulaceae bacterium]|nr:MauE/DoxX family redox-associated membrane protein [Lacipirellulaceae bacterium]